MTAFETRRILRFGDCDPAGIAYFPAYFHLLNSVVEEFFEVLGAPWTRLIHQDRVGLPTAQLNVSFKKHGLHGDTLVFRVHVRRIGRSSLDLQHEVFANNALLWQADQTLVMTSLETHKPIAFPPEIRNELTKRLEKKHAEIPAT
jgi:4-hydroxybenzoyl-CoA thioesterase